MNIEQLQQGLIYWFWLEPSQFKSYAQVANICDKLYKQWFPNKVKYSIYELFYPLLRIGVVEFYGENNFGLSPTSVLINEQKSVFVNMPRGVTSLLIDLSTLVTITKGMEVIKTSSMAIEHIKKHNLPAVQFSLGEWLPKCSSFQSVINSWQDDTVINSSNYLHFSKSSSWQRNDSSNQVGVYKKSSESYSQRTVKISNEVWKLLPSRNLNIDAFNVAVMWTYNQHSWNLDIHYIIKENRLIIKNLFFPILIERLLCINTLLGSDYDVFKRNYFLGVNDFHILNKMFNNQIEAK